MLIMYGFIFHIFHILYLHICIIIWISVEKEVQGELLIIILLFEHGFGIARFA